MEFVDREKNDKVIETYLNGLYYERSEKQFDDDLLYGNYNYTLESCVKNYFDKPIFILDSLNNFVEVKSETTRNYNQLSKYNKIVIRTRSALKDLNQNTQMFDSKESKGSELIITKEMFDDDDIMYVLELSMYIGFNKLAVERRKRDNPDVGSLIDKKELLGDLFINSFNSLNSFIEIMISDPNNNFGDTAYTIVNGGVLTIPVLKAKFYDEGIVICCRNEDKVNRYEFPLEDLASDETPKFEIGDGCFYISTIKSNIERVLKQKYSNSHLGIKLKYTEEIKKLKEEMEETQKELEKQIRQLNAEKDSDKLEIKELNVELKKEKILIDEMFFKLDVLNQIDDKTKDRIKSLYDYEHMRNEFQIKNKELEVKDKELNFKEVKMEKDLEFIDKKRELVIDKLKSDKEIAMIQKDKEKIKVDQNIFSTTLKLFDMVV